MNKTFASYVADYSAHKLREHGDGKVTRNEILKLRESFKAQFGQKQVRESTSQSWDTYLKSYKKFKEEQDPGAKITYKELKLLKENFKEAVRKGVTLREADAGFDPAAGGAPQAGDPNAMAADPNAAVGGMPAQVDPTISAQIQDVVQSVNALAASAGVQTNDLGANAAAGTPPVDGMQQPGQDPNAAVPGAPMMEACIRQFKAWKKANIGTDRITEAEMNKLKEEVWNLTVKRFANWKQSTKGTSKLTESEVDGLKKLFIQKQQPKSRYDQIKERIAARQEQLKNLNEGYLDIPTVAELGTLTAKPMQSNSHGGDHTTSPDPFPAPTATQLANGYSSGKAAKETSPGKTWPTKATGKEAGGALQGKGATQTKVNEGVKTVTEVYVDNHLAEKLDFTKVKSAMKSGLLG